MAGAKREGTALAAVPVPLSPVEFLTRGRRIIMKVIDPLGVVGIILSVGLWYAIASTVPAVPLPHYVLANAANNIFDSADLSGIGLPRGGYFPHLLYTLKNVLLGGSIGAVIGVIFALFSYESRVIDQITDPIVTLLGTVPILVTAPFFLLWLGVSAISQIVLVAFYTALVLHVFTYRGISNQPAYYEEYAETLGATHFLRFFLVRFPSAIPEIFGGLRIAIGAAWGLAAVTEMLGASFGTGRVIIALRSVYDLTGIMAVVLLLGLIAAIVDGFLVFCRVWATRWMSAGRAL